MSSEQRRPRHAHPIGRSARVLAALRIPVIVVAAGAAVTLSIIAFALQP